MKKIFCLFMCVCVLLPGIAQADDISEDDSLEWEEVVALIPPIVVGAGTAGFLSVYGGAAIFSGALSPPVGCALFFAGPIIGGYLAHLLD